MELALAAMTPLIKKLGNLLASELALENSVEKDVARLKRELEILHAELQRVDPIKQRARNLRELSYDMEDAIEAFFLYAGKDDDPAAAGLTSQLSGFLNKTSRLFSRKKALHHVNDAVSEATKLSNELGEVMVKYAWPKEKDVGASGSSPTNIDSLLTAMYIEEKDLVGVEAARDELIRILSDCSDMEVKTVSIFGFGGLGKTTLAKVVYDRMKGQYNCGAFVSVSRSPDINKIFRLMLFELDKERYMKINEAVRDTKQLIDELRAFLQDKRYLIVIDDLWDEKVWESIKHAFPKNTCGSRLITTSRNHNISNGSDKIYEMKPLSDEDSLRLFHSRIFQYDKCPTELEQVSRDILKKCGGVPLPIISIASLLVSQKQVKRKDQWLMLLNSIGHGLAGCLKVKDMHMILSLSYYDLPYHLKPCLLYLSIFPEDYKIERNRLIWMWIAEGFIEHENTSGYDNLFEIGESYFIELVNRSMIQPIDIDVEGRAKACRVHDIMLDLIRSLSSEGNFVTIWGKHELIASSSDSLSRRLSIQNNTTAHEATMRSMSKVRSLTIFTSDINSMPSLSQFQVVRVLDLEGCDLRKCGSHFNLRHVGKLSHLRYLGLTRTWILELPVVEIAKLKFLQTLDVRRSLCENVMLWTITGMRNLMHLHLDSGIIIPKGLGKLTSLEELTGLPIGGDDSKAIVTELGHLTRLRVLMIFMQWTEVLSEALMQSLGNLRKLQSLEVHALGGNGDLMHGWAPPPRLSRFVCIGHKNTAATLPAWTKNSSLSLTFLDVSIGQVGSDDLQALGALPWLRGVRLRMAGRINEGGRSPAWMEVNAGAFPCVRSCAFLNFQTVPSMFRPGAMPRMQLLDFSVRAWDFADVDGGRGFGLDDLSLGHLPSLEEVHVHLWYDTKEDDHAVAERVQAALRAAAKGHPNHVALRISKRFSLIQG